MAGRPKLKDGYIVNLEDVLFGIACKESPSKGTEVDVVFPVYYNGEDFLERCAFLLEGKIWQSCIDDSYPNPLEFSTMRRNFYIYDQFPERGTRGTYKEDTMYDYPHFTYYYRIRKQENSAFRRDRHD